MLSHKQAKGLNDGIRPAKLDEKVLICCLKVCLEISFGSFVEDSTSKFFYLLYCKFFYLVFSKDFFICLVCKFFLLGILQDILRLLVFAGTGACRRRL